MILRTFENDLDGITNKLGVGKRSIAELRTQISQVFNQGGKGLNGFKNALSTAFTSPLAMNEIKLINKSDFNSLFNMDSDQFFKNFNQNGSASLSTLTQWTNRIEKMDDTMRSYLVDCMQKQAPASFEGYQAYAQKAIKANEQFSLTAKAGQTVLKGFSMAVNMLAFAAIAKVIEVAATSINNYVHRVENANNAMKDAVSAYESTKSELESIDSELAEHNELIQELQNKEHLTYAEKGQLEELQAITKELLTQQDITENNLNREQSAAAIKAVKAYEQQYGDYDISETVINKNLEYARLTGATNFTTGDDDIAGNITELIHNQTLLAEISKQLQDTENLSDIEQEMLDIDFQNYTDRLSELNTAIEASLADLATKKSAMEAEYQQIGQKQLHGDILTTDEQNILSSYEEISENIRLIYQYTDPNKWNHIQLSDVFNTEGLEASKNELIAMAHAGELTPETITGYANLYTALENCDLILESGQTSAEAFCEEIKALANNTDNLTESLNVDSELKDAFSSIQDSASVMQDFKSAMESSQFSDSVLTSVGSLSTKLNDMVAGFYAGSVSVDQLYQALSEHYHTDLQNYGNILLAKEECNEAFYHTLGLADASLINSFRENYDIDLQNCKNYNQAKLQIENQTLNTLGTWWKKYYNAQSMTFTSGMDALKQSAANGNTEAQKQYTQLMAQVSTYEQASSAFENITYEGISANYNHIANPKNTSSDDATKSNLSSHSESTSAASETTESFNFIETLLSRLSTAFDTLKSKGENTLLTFKARTNAYGKSLANITKQIEAQNAARSIYMEKANAIGLAPEWIEKIQHGSLEIAQVSDPVLKQQIQDYQTWYEKALDCEATVKDLKHTQTELAQAKIETLITKYDKLNARAEAANDRISKRISQKEVWGFTAGTSDYTKMNQNLSTQLKNNDKMIASLKKLQQNFSKGSEVWLDYQQQIDQTTNSSKELTTAMAENAKAAATLAKEKAESKVSKLDSKDELYDAKIENATDATSKNKLIDKQLKSIDKRQQTYETAYATSTSNLNTSADTLAGMKTKKINTGNKTKNKANKTYNTVLEKVQKRVNAGKRITENLLTQAASLNDNGKLYDACVRYNANFDAAQENKLILEMYQETSKQDKAALAMEQFQNIESDYDSKLSGYDQRKTIVNNRISLANAKGEAASASDYQELIGIEEETIQTLLEKRARFEQELSQAVAEGSIVQNSSEWLEMQDAITTVTNELDASNQALVEYNNSIRQLEWDKFDDAAEKLKRDNSEIEYYLDLLNNQKLVDEDSGEFTEYGKSALALRKAGYANYQTQAAAYLAEYNSLQEQINNGELSATNETVIDRMYELEDAYRLATLAAENEKEAIADLIKEGYDAQLNSLSDLISSYKELRQSERDAYEYEKSIAEKTKHISTLQKQLSAMNGDTSEEARARIQQIKVDLESAREELEETQYNKYLSDSEEMLDDMYADYEQFINDKLENTNDILTGISGLLGSEGDIVSTLTNIEDNLLAYANANPLPVSVFQTLPTALPELMTNTTEHTITVSIGDIILNDVNHPDEFADSLKSAINNNASVRRLLQNESIGAISNDFNSLSGRRF